VLRGCANLTSIIVPSSSSLSSTVLNSLPLCQQATEDTTYSSTTGTKRYTVKQTMTSLVIPANASSIDDFSYSGCTSLVSVVIPDSVTSIGTSAFQGCPFTCITGWNSSIPRYIGKRALPTNTSCGPPTRSPTTTTPTTSSTITPKTNPTTSPTRRHNRRPTRRPNRPATRRPNRPATRRPNRPTTKPTTSTTTATTRRPTRPIKPAPKGWYWQSHTPTKKPTTK